MKRNARGGVVIESGHIDPDTLPASAYGSTTQCPPGACGHRLTEEQWHPRYKPFKDKLCSRCGNAANEMVVGGCTSTHCYFDPPTYNRKSRKKRVAA